MRGLADDLTCTAALELIRAAMLLSFKLSEIVCRQTTIFGASCSRCGTPPGTHSSSTALYRSLSAIALNNMLATAEPRADLTCSRIFGPSKRIERSSVLCSLAWSPSGPLLIVTSAGTASERCRDDFRGPRDFDRVAVLALEDRRRRSLCKGLGWSTWWPIPARGRVGEGRR
jgi:hypothetical protein